MTKTSGVNKMSLINVMKKASLSRVAGGLILLRTGVPVLRADLHRFIDEVENSNDKRKHYFHLDEETCVLTQYSLVKDKTYTITDQHMVSLKYLSEIQIEYERMSGTDLRKLRYRLPFILPTGHEF